MKYLNQDQTAKKGTPKTTPNVHRMSESHELNSTLGRIIIVEGIVTTLKIHVVEIHCGLKKKNEKSIDYSSFFTTLLFI
jgi:hypothetical protein